MNKIKGAHGIGHFIFMLSYLTLAYSLFLPLPGILLGHLFSFGWFGLFFGRFWLAELALVLSPVLAFLTYLIFFWKKEEFVPFEQIKYDFTQPKVTYISYISKIIGGE